MGAETRCGCHRGRRWARVVGVAAVATLLVGLAAPAGAVGWPVRRGPTGPVALPTLGGADAFARAINNAGVAVGSSLTAAGARHAARWDAAGRVTDLGTLGGQSLAAAINDAGTIVGSSIDSAGQFHAVRWSPTGRMTDLGTGEATAINDAGVAVGYRDAAAGRWAVRWDRAGRTTWLDRFPDTEDIDARAISRTGLVIGVARVSSGRSGAVRWDRAGRISWLAARPGRNTFPAGLNDQRTIIGQLETTDDPGQWHAARWDRRGRLVDLGTLPGGHYSGPVAIAPNGTIAGWSDLLGGQFHAVRWDRAGRIHDLGGLPGGTGSNAFGMNRRTTIVGSATGPDGRVHAVCWDATGRIVDLGAVPGQDTIGSAINDTGTVIGHTVSPGADFRPLKWHL